VKESAILLRIGNVKILQRKSLQVILNKEAALKAFFVYLFI